MLLGHCCACSPCVVCCVLATNSKWDEKKWKRIKENKKKKKHNKMKEMKRSNGGFLNIHTSWRSGWKSGRLPLSVVGCLANFVIDLEFVYSPLNMLFEEWIHSDRHKRTHKILILVYIWSLPFSICLRNNSLALAHSHTHTYSYWYMVKKWEWLGWSIGWLVGRFSCCRQAEHEHPLPAREREINCIHLRMYTHTQYECLILQPFSSRQSPIRRFNSQQ